MKIDIYNHVMPAAYLELMKQHSKDQGRWTQRAQTNRQLTKTSLLQH